MPSGGHLSCQKTRRRRRPITEAGHALVSIHTPASDPIHKATVIPRGRSLGMVQYLPERDQVSYSFEQLTSMLATAMGGRVAEQLTFGDEKVTAGAQQDITQATKIARAMVTQWGFSKELGTVAYGENQEEVFLGHSVARQQNVSEETSRKIDAEVRRLVDEAYGEATKILTDHSDQLETLAQALLEYETLSGDEIKDLLDGKRPVREDPSDETPTTPTSGSAVPNTGNKPKPDGGGESGMEPQPT